jgi:chromosome segregation ATPase
MQPIANTWLPQTLGGLIGVLATIFLISGAGSVAAVWKWLMQPLRREIKEAAATFQGVLEKESRERVQADKEEREARTHDYQLLTHNEYGVLTRHKANLKQDIDSVGMKYNALEAETRERESRVSKLEDRMRDSEHDRGTLHKEVGALESSVKSFREEQTQMRVDVIAHIQGAKKETLDAIAKLGDRVGDVEQKVAVIDDRQRRSEQQ